MRDLSEVMREITAADVKKGFEEYDKARNEWLFPHVHGPNRIEFSGNGQDLTEQVSDSFRRIDKAFPTPR